MHWPLVTGRRFQPLQKDFLFALSLSLCAVFSRVYLPPPTLAAHTSSPAHHIHAGTAAFCFVRLLTVTLRALWPRAKAAVEGRSALGLFPLLFEMPTRKPPGMSGPESSWTSPAETETM